MENQQIQFPSNLSSTDSCLFTELSDVQASTVSGGGFWDSFWNSFHQWYWETSGKKTAGGDLKGPIGVVKITARPL